MTDVYTETFNLGSNTELLLFSSQIQSNMKHMSYNMYQAMGLIGNATPGSSFETAIGKFPINGGSIRYYIRHPKTGAPRVGSDTQLRDDATTRERPSQQLRSVDFTMPGELIGTDYRNAILHAPIYRDITTAISEWMSSMEFEILMTYSSGGRGNNDGYEVFQETHEGVPLPSNLPAEWEGIHAVNPITTPTRTLAMDQTLDTFGDNIDYSAVGSWANSPTQGVAGTNSYINYLTDIRTYLKVVSRVRDGYSLEPAKMMIPPEMREKKSVEMQRDAYVLLISEQLANRIMKRSDWQTLQLELTNYFGLKQGISTGYLGKIQNLVVAANDLITRFTVGANRFTRGIIYGRQSLAMGYYMYKVPIRYKARKELGTKTGGVLSTPFRCWVNGLNKSKNSEILAECNFGVRVVSFDKPGTTTKVDRGLTVVDFREGGVGT